MRLSRRQFVALSAPAMMSFGVRTPRFLVNAAEQSGRSRQEKILVVVQLSGGNDGLNTVVPFNHDNYRKLRPKLAIPEREVLKINQELGLHPSLTGFAELLENNQLGIVQGVGYPNPNRSHFESMDIWHTCLRKNETRLDGWLGRALDFLQQSDSNGVSALHLGDKKQPFALSSRTHRVPSVKSLEQFRLELERRESLNEIRNSVSSKRMANNPLLEFVQSSTETAIDVSQKLQQATTSYKTNVSYPESMLGSQLKTIAQLIDADLATRIFYVEVDGFDTHAEQTQVHTSLLREVSDGLHAFVNDLNQHGHGDRVLAVCFSEFGRRVSENASDGTDHGTAAPMFLVGNKVQAGLIGAHPSLTDLDQGDLKYHTDFREVYAGLLKDWLNVDPDSALHGQFRAMELVTS